MTREAAAQRLGRWNAAVATNVSKRGARGGVETRDSYRYVFREKSICNVPGRVGGILIFVYLQLSGVMNSFRF